MEKEKKTFENPLYEAIKELNAEIQLSNLGYSCACMYCRLGYKSECEYKSEL